jgi:hypothetical protein
MSFYFKEEEFNQLIEESCKKLVETNKSQSFTLYKSEYAKQFVIHAIVTLENYIDERLLVLKQTLQHEKINRLAFRVYDYNADEFYIYFEFSETREEKRERQRQIGEGIRARRYSSIKQ